MGFSFGSSVNPITTRGTDYAHHITASLPGFEIPAASLLIERRSFDQKYKFSNKNDMVCAWRNFQKNSCGISAYDK